MPPALLHPESREFLDRVNASASGGRPLSEISPGQMREGFDGLILDVVAAMGGRPEPVARIVDHHVPVAGGELTARAYESEGADCVVALFHGGGYVIGGLASVDGLARRLAGAAGAVVVSVSYRLAPEHRFPTAPEDAYTAIEWIAAEGAGLGWHPQRLAVAGDSAGATLAAVCCGLARDRGGPPIAAQILFSPVTSPDTRTPSFAAFGEGHLITEELLGWFDGHYFPEGLDRRQPLAYPLLAKELSGLPAAFLAAAGCDPKRDDARRYADALAAAGVSVDSREYAGMLHGFASSCDALSVGRQAVADAAALARRSFDTTAAR